METGVTFDWADGTYYFRLGIGEVKELESIFGIGLPHLFKLIVTDDIRTDHYEQIIRLGLIGGGMDPAAALKLCRRYLDLPMLRHREPAVKILGPAIVLPDQSLGKLPAGEAKEEATKTTASSPPQSIN